MTEKKKEPKWAKEWKEIKKIMNLIDGYHWTDEWLTLLQAKPEENDSYSYTDTWLDNKLAWFLVNGATGIIFLVDYVWGDKGLDVFFEFLRWFVQNDYEFGHYHPSKALRTAINEHQGIIKNSDVDDLIKMLQDFSKNLETKDGISPKEAVGWQPKMKKKS